MDERANTVSAQNHTGKCVGKPPCVNERFRGFAHKCSTFVGAPWAFASAVIALVIWAAFGPVAGFSNTWQLIVNTATTIVTFLMVFLIQNTQNRDAKAIHLKLDELIHAVKGARNQLISLENLSDEELMEIEKRFKRIRENAGAASDKSKSAAGAEPKS